MPTRLYSLEGRSDAPKVVDVTLKKTSEDDPPPVKEEAEYTTERVTVEEVRKSGHTSIRRFSLFRFVARGWGRDAEDGRKKKGDQNKGKKKGTKSDKEQGAQEEEDEMEERKDETEDSSGDSEDRRERLDRDMKKNWADLPATLRRKRLRERESILAEFHHDSLASDASQTQRSEPGPSGVDSSVNNAPSSKSSDSDNLQRTLSRDSLLSTPSSFASSSRASSSASSSTGPAPSSSSSSSTSSSPPPSANQSPTPEQREARRSSSHPDVSSSCPSADNEYETVEVEHAAFRRPSPSSSSGLLTSISPYNENQNHSEDSGTDCDHTSTGTPQNTRGQRTGHRVTFGTPEIPTDSTLGDRSDDDSVEIRIIKKEEDEGEKGWRLWVGKKGVTVLPDVEVSETSTAELKDSLEVKSEESVKTEEFVTACSSESSSTGRSVKELLRKFEECGVVLSGIARESEEQPTLEVENVTEVERVPKDEQNEGEHPKESESSEDSNFNVEEDDEDSDDKNDTLRDIQETLQRLEEKVRLYESRLASEYMSRIGGTSTPLRSCLEEGTFKNPQPNNSSAPVCNSTPESSGEEGTNISVVEVDGKGGSKIEVSAYDKSLKHQKARAQMAFQQGNAKVEQHDVLLSGWNRNHAGSGQTAASPTATSAPFHSLPTTPVSPMGPPSHASPSPGTPPPISPGSDSEARVSSVHDGRHSLLQFAMFHFRQSPEKFEMLKTADGTISGSLKVIESLKGKKALGGGKKGGSGGKEGAKDVADWTWKEQVDLVKFTSTPIEESLLRLESPELSALAVECFVSVMRYMGDLPMPTPDTTEVKCVYTILMHCHKHEALRDEVYCQLMKQTTNNKSRQPESCQRGWRLFSIVAAYFICSTTLKPYLFKYLETAAYDKRRAYHGTATVCLQNLRKTFKYGGRKNVPSVEEITAISAGRNSKRQIYRLPGGTERVINTKSTTVVQDIIEEICSVINVRDSHEMEEFSLYCIVEGDTFTMPLAREEYVLDVTTELQKNQQVFFLIFCRSVWHHPLRLDSSLYVEVVFNQIAPDYLEGLLLVMPGEQLEQEAVYDIAKIAALLHRAADIDHMPLMKEIKFLLPKPALAVRDIKPPQWVNMVQSNWREVEGLTPMQAKAHTLDILQKWPLFGSSFFAVKRISDPKERSDHILALNRNGVHFIDLVTHETLLHYPFAEVISTRKVKSEDGALFLDMKCGNLMQQRITRLQTDQAHEISRLIRQYITMEQRQRGINGNHSEQQLPVGNSNEVPVSR